MTRTDDTSLYISLLERLPFKDMLFFFPEGAFPILLDEEIAGMYIHIERHHELLWVFFNCLNRTYKNGSQVLPGICIAFPITDGMKISQAFETPQFMEWLSAYKRAILFGPNQSEQEIEKVILSMKKVLSTAINLLYYLSSKNADIKAIKNQKKSHKPSPNSNGDNTPAVKLHEVGAKYAEIVYRRLTEDTGATEDDDDKNNEDIVIRTINSTKKRRPHARRAHWQHYWTGKGRTTLEVRWISDLFVGTNRDDQAVIVYDIAKDSLKGKRNPNTSKKKRSK